MTERLAVCLAKLTQLWATHLCSSLRASPWQSQDMTAAPPSVSNQREGGGSSVSSRTEPGKSLASCWLHKSALFDADGIPQGCEQEVRMALERPGGGTAAVRRP